MKKNNIILVLLCLIFPFQGLSADGNFQGFARPNPVVEGQRLQVTYTLSTNGSKFRGPDFKNFKVLSGPNKSSSTRIVNGNMSRNLSFSYVLEAKKKGTFTIAPATVRSEGSTLKSNSLIIQVFEPSQAEQTRRRKVANQEKTMGKQAQALLSKNIYIRTNISKTNVYPGEQVVVSYKLFRNSQIRVSQMELGKQVQFKGCWSQDVTANKASWKQEVIDNNVFETIVVKKTIIMPQQTGKIVIEPMEVDFIAKLQVQGGQRRSRRSMFDDFFDRGNYKEFKYKAKSKRLVLNVKELPANAPTSFNGSIGSLKMEAYFDMLETVANEPVTLKVKISGKGNLKLIEPLDIKFPNDFEVYEPKTVDNINVSSSGVSGNKTFEYLIIPRNAGQYKINPVEFTYFDLKKKEYVTLMSEPFQIKVGKGDGTTPSGRVYSGISKEDVKYIGEDIRFIIDFEEGSLRKRGKTFFGSGFYIALNVTPFVLLLLVMMFRKKRNELQGNQSLLKNKRATKVAKKQLAVAKTYLDKSDSDKFYEETSRALWGYLSDKLSIPQSDLTKDNAMKVLESKRVNSDIINKILSTIDHCEFARYAPTGGSKEMTNIFEDAVSVISELEGQLK